LHDVCLQNLNVIFAIDRAGIVGPDGETHQGIFDLSYLLHIPQMTVLAPSCKEDFEQMLNYSANNNIGPVAIRYPKGEASSRKCSRYEYGMPECVLSAGYEVVLVGVGKAVDACIKAGEILKSSNVSVTVINLRTLKPLNKSYIENLVEKSQITFTVEDNVIIGGCGSYIVSEINPQLRNKIINIGYDDCYITQGEQNELLDLHGITPEKIAKRVEKELSEFGRQN